jgi:protein-disulfide isomerase
VLVVAALVILAIAFAARTQIQARRGPLVLPAHRLGPNQGELLGSPSAPVLVEEYGDFQCPVCGRFQATTGPTVRQLVDQGRIRFVFHEQPILGRESVVAANAATCAGDDGKFWPYHDLLYAEQAPENSGALSPDRLIQLGARAGVGGDRFTRCVRGATYDPWLRQVVNQGSVRGVNVTPTFYVDGRKVRVDSPAELTDAVRRAGG